MAQHRPSITKAPFYGRGLGFPFRVDPARGGAAITDGASDDPAVALEYMGDRFTIREVLPDRSNHIAESIRHILMVAKGEYDTLPEFGSEINHMVFEPNSLEFRVFCEHYFAESTARWERRVAIDEQRDVEWTVSDQATDQHRLGCKLTPQFIRTQVAGNLVAPFVNSRQARAQEYPLGDSDGNGHDWTSRYLGRDLYQGGSEPLLRIRPSLLIEPRPDDIFYEVRHFDTWLLISHRVYGDIRHWHVIAECAVQDAANREESRDVMDTNTDPEPGTVLRMPSRTRLLMELAA
ncbi:MAG: GPW/gp25 family protein [Thermodesulfobacteriota bacterium]